MPPNTQLFKVRPTRLECLFGKRHLLQGNPCVGGQCEHRADLTLASTRLHPQATAGRETDACSSRGHGAAHTSGCRPPSHRFPGRSRPPHSLPSAHFAFPLHPLAFPFQYLLSFSFLLHAGWQTCKLRGGPAGRMAHTPRANGRSPSTRSARLTRLPSTHLLTWTGDRTQLPLHSTSTAHVLECHARDPTSP